MPGCDWLPSRILFLFCSTVAARLRQPSSGFYLVLSPSFKQQMFLVPGLVPDTYLSHMSEGLGLLCVFGGGTEKVETKKPLATL